MKSQIGKNLRTFAGGFGLILLLCSSAFAVDRCAGLYSPGNPYQCVSSPGVEGNCTWFAWYKAQTVWGIRLPGWSGDAKVWADRAKAANFPWSSKPGSLTIGVSSTLSSFGHVAFVLEVSGTSVHVLEMEWGKNGWKDTWRPTSQFNMGFFRPNGGSFVVHPIVSSLSPYAPFMSTSNQWVTLNGSYLYAPLIIDLTAPSGLTYTVKGGQIAYLFNSAKMYVTLSARGTWSLRAISSNGQRSDPYYFAVR